MVIRISDARLRGSLLPPLSKSALHRAILCAALAEGESLIRPFEKSEDVSATLRAASALGAALRESEDGLYIRGIAGKCTGEKPVIDCAQSGTTLRFLIPLTAALCGGGSFLCSGRLAQRPLTPYYELFRHRAEGNTLCFDGGLAPGDYALPGDLSSQFFSGLMLALPLAGGGKLRWSGELQSADYVKMTAQSLRLAGIGVSFGDGEICVPAGSFRAAEYTPERDWSHSAFWIAARHFGGEIELGGLEKNSFQPDRRIAEIAETLRRDGDAEIDLRQCPDLAPAVAAMAAVRRGKSILTGCERLRYKESDRAESIVSVLTALGAEISENQGRLLVTGRDKLDGGVRLNCRGDHRIVMMAAVTAAACEKEIEIEDAECVEKSYPAFWEDFKALGGTAYAV